jgi:hypothetical protein
MQRDYLQEGLEVRDSVISFVDASLVYFRPRQMVTHGYAVQDSAEDAGGREYIGTFSAHIIGVQHYRGKVSNGEMVRADTRITRPCPCAARACHGAFSTRSPAFR